MVGGCQGKYHVASHVRGGIVNTFSDFDIGLSIDRYQHCGRAADSSIRGRQTDGIGEAIVSCCAGVWGIGECTIGIESHIAFGRIGCFSKGRSCLKNIVGCNISANRSIHGSANWVVNGVRTYRDREGTGSTQPGKIENLVIERKCSGITHCRGKFKGTICR